MTCQQLVDRFLVAFWIIGYLLVTDSKKLAERRLFLACNIKYGPFWHQYRLSNENRGLIFSAICLSQLFLTGSQREAAGSGRQAEDQVEPRLEAHLFDRCHQRQVRADHHDDNFLTAVFNFRRRSKIWPINISIRSDLSDMDKVKLAAKAKMEGNLADLLPKKYKGGRELEDKEDELEGRLVFTDTSTTEASETVDPNKKWSTVVFSELPSDPAKSDGDMKKEKVSSLTKRFETKNMKDNEAYVIM